MSDDEEDESVSVATFTDIMEAEIACGALHAAGIPAEIPNEGGHLARRAAPTQFLEIRVFARDRDEALKILGRAGRE